MPKIHITKSLQNVLNSDDKKRCFEAKSWCDTTTRIIINHSTLDYHVTKFNTFTRWLRRTNQNLYTDLYPNTINQNPHHINPNPNEKFDLLSYMAMHVMSCDQSNFKLITFQGSILTLHHEGVRVINRNQRSKYVVNLNYRGPFRKISKFECI